MRILFTLVFFLCSLPIAAANVSDNDQRPGSRSIYVVDNNGSSIKLMLRKCCCELSTKYIEKRARFCKCFANFDPEDQPFTQGNPFATIAHYQKFGACFAGFGGGVDPVTKQFFCKLPTPEELLKILQVLKIDHLESWC